MFKLLLPLFSLVFVLFSGKDRLVVFCPLLLEDERAFLHSTLCIILGYSSREESMLNAFLHLPCKEVGTTWTLHYRALEGWVAVASMNMSWRARFPRFSPHKAFPLAAIVLL